MITLLLQDILLGLKVTINGGAQRPLFNSMSQDNNGEWGALSSQAMSCARRWRARSQLYHMAFKMNATEAWATNFLCMAFQDSHRRLALKFSYRDGFSRW